MREIGNQPAVSLPAVITTALSRAKLMLDNLDQLMQVELLKSADGSSRTPRRAEARNKFKVNRAKSEPPVELAIRLLHATVEPRRVRFQNDDTDAVLLLNGESFLSNFTIVVVLTGFGRPENRISMN